MLTSSQRSAAVSSYIANVDYEADATGATAIAFRGAVRTLLLDPTSASTVGRSYSRDNLQTQLENVEAWLHHNGLDNRTTSLAAIGFGRTG